MTPKPTAAAIEEKQRARLPPGLQPGGRLRRGPRAHHQAQGLELAFVQPPAQSEQRDPPYLTKEPPEEVRECNLSFVEDAGLQERFDRLEAEGTPRVDIIEQIVLNNLPEAERTYRPKRRRRSLL